MCPPGVDQTERGSQEWQVLAPRRRKIEILAPLHSIYGTCGPLEYLFNNQNSWNAWSKLAHAAPPYSWPLRQSLCKSGNRKSSLSKLESLPSELLASIIEDTVLTKNDVLALGMASETLWVHVLQYVDKSCSLTQPCMAGVEIACTGTYLVDLPESFARDDLARSSVEIWPGDYMCQARRINWAARESYDPVGESPEEAWRAAWAAQNGHLVGFAAEVAQKMRAELFALSSGLRGSSPDALWVLRNLSTREYVRCRPGEGHVERRGLLDCKDGKVPVSVDDVLLLRICWTMRDDWGGALSRGKWAGHCFDIVPWERLDGEEGWTDSTSEVLEEATIKAEAMLPENHANSAFKIWQEIVEYESKHLPLSDPARYRLENSWCDLLPFSDSARSRFEALCRLSEM